jgi:hypothetical protein
VRTFWVCIILLAACLYLWRRQSPIEHPPGTLVTKAPEQINFTARQPTIPHEGWTLTPLAMFALDARLLSLQFYDEDITAKLAPCDLALGWGRMSDTAVLERLDISQSSRFYQWRFWGTPPIPEKEIVTHSANMHIIPANASVADRLKSLRKGSLVRLSGVLVEATHPKAEKPWRSSLSREDRGEGACEVFYVKSLSER